MAQIKDLVAGFFQCLPVRAEISEERLAKLVYLADWKHAIQNDGRQITELKWYFDSYGPYASQVFDIVHRSPIFRTRQLSKEWEDSQFVVALFDHSYDPTLKPSERDAIRHVTSVAAARSWGELIKLVSSTYPILAGPRYEFINMPAMAKAYVQLMREIANRKPAGGLPVAGRSS